MRDGDRVPRSGSWGTMMDAFRMEQNTRPSGPDDVNSLLYVAGRCNL